MRVIAVGNQKGGVAKTTTCLSLGGVLASKGQTVLLLDLDPQANLTMSLGIQPESLRRSVAGIDNDTGSRRTPPIRDYLKTANVIARSTATKQSQCYGWEIASLHSQ